MRICSLILFASIVVGGSAPFAQPIEIASISSAGVQGEDIRGRFAGPAIHGNGQSVAGASYSPTLSASGQFVCFVSAAANLVPLDTNSVEDIFVRDLLAGTTERVRLGNLARQANSSTALASIGAVGRWVMFSSRPVRRVHPRS